MNYKKQFKIIAIRPLSGCADYIVKTLEENTPYFFYNNYEMYYQEGKKFIRPTGERPLPNEFFYAKNSNREQTPLISISAMVGKNGDGKSTLIELMMRMLNNFAYAYYLNEEARDLTYIDNIHAELYFSCSKSENNNEIIYQLKIQNNEVSLSTDKECLWLYPDDTNTRFPDEHLFFSLFINYSLYAYNTNDFSQENKDGKNWLKYVFLKNDSYQTPLVLQPPRKEGNMNVNTEADLSKQRIISLFTTNDESNNSFRWINEKQFADSLYYSLEKTSKLETSSLYTFFLKTQSDNHILSIKDKLRIQIIINRLKNKQSLSFEYKNLIKILHCLTGYVQNKTGLFSEAVHIKNKIIDELSKARNKTSLWLPEKTDLELFHEYLSQIYDLGNKNQELEKAITQLKSIQLLNSTQFMRVVWIDFLREEWKVQIKNRLKEPNINQTVYDKLIDYLAYKSISITKKYSRYKNHNYKLIFTDRFDEKDISHSIQSKCESLIRQIWEDNSPVTLKIRQTLNYIRHNGYGIDLRKDTINFTDYYEKTETCCRPGKEIIENLLPPVFETDVILTYKKEKSNSKKASCLSMLSSGEKQLLSVASSIIYHLRNLNSVVRTYNNSHYSHVNIIMEEVELYFHPEFQRQFINYLITNIAKVNLKHLESINLIFVTHSPLILSDIPVNNVLFLRDGKPNHEMRKESNTFGANLYDIISHGFFLKNTMGDFATGKIRALIWELNSSDLDIMDSKTFHDLEYHINMIGEPFIREELKRELYEKAGTEKEWEIKRLEERLRILKEERNDLVKKK